MQKITARKRLGFLSTLDSIGLLGMHCAEQSFNKEVQSQCDLNGKNKIQYSWKAREEDCYRQGLYEEGWNEGS